MVKRFLIISLLSFFTIFCSAQNNRINHQLPDGSGLFKRGLYLENKKLMIPWGVHFSKIADYGNPKIVREKKTLAYVRWDSVTILGGLHVNVIYTYSKALLERKSDMVVKMLQVQIDPGDLARIKALLTLYSGMPGKSSGRRGDKQYHFYWLIDGCNVKLSVYRNKYFYLMMQKRSL